MELSKVVGMTPEQFTAIQSLGANYDGCIALLEWLSSIRIEQETLLQKTALAALHNADMKQVAHQLEGGYRILDSVTGTLGKIFKGDVK